MPETKGPKVDLPPELEEALAGADGESTASGETSAADVSGGVANEHAKAVEDLEREKEQLEDRLLRLAADFENFKRRALRERQELLTYANEGMIKELLPAVDNLERAVSHGRQALEGGDARSILEGVELTYRSLMQILEKFGVQQIRASGERFDPALHEAMRSVPSDEHDSGTVLEEHQRGYLLKDRLLRPALVTVSSRSGES